VIDLSALYDEDAEDADEFPKEWLQQMVFINPEVLEESEEEDDYNEGCLSLPDLREAVRRPVALKATFLDRNFKTQTLEMDGMLARCFQHELDHLDGILFIDHISAFKRKLLQRKLREIQKGITQADYPMK
jgi:peptide deformylase